MLLQALIASGRHPFKEPKRGELTIIEDDGTRLGRAGRQYGVEIYGEHDGVWIGKHTRGSGRWERTDRAAHSNMTKSVREPA